MTNTTFNDTDQADLLIIEHELTDAMALLLELGVLRHELPRLTAARRLLLNALTRTKRITAGVAK